MADHAWSEAIHEQRDALKDAEGVLKVVGESVILPLLERRYDASGLKKGTVLKPAITKAGAKGNIFEVRGNTLTVGIDYTAIPYAKAQIEGSPAHEIRPRRRKRLRFEKDGKIIFARIVKHPGTKPHPIYADLGAQEQAQANKAVLDTMGASWTLRKL